MNLDSTPGYTSYKRRLIKVKEFSFQIVLPKSVKICNGYICRNFHIWIPHIGISTNRSPRSPHLKKTWTQLTLQCIYIHSNITSINTQKHLHKLLSVYLLLIKFFLRLWYAFEFWKEFLSFISCKVTFMYGKTARIF